MRFASNSRHGPRVWLALSISLTLLTTVGCGSAQPSPTTSASAPQGSAQPQPSGPGKELVIALSLGAPSMDTVIAGPTHYEKVTLFDALVGVTPNMELAPGLATSWEQINPTTWELELRDDVRFHNGDPFDADDVLFTLERAKNPDVAGLVGPVNLPALAEWRKTDDFTVQLVTAKPDINFVRRLTGVFPMPADYFESVGAEGFDANPVGTGPYKFVSWTPTESVVLEANDDYWKGVPQIKNVTMRVVTDPSARVSMLLAGEAHLIDYVPPGQIQTIDSTEGVETLPVVSTDRVFIGYQALRGPFENKVLRQALNYAVDWETIIATILGGNGKRAATLWSTWEFGLDPSVEPYPYDPDRASQLLADAGYPGGAGLTIELASPRGRYTSDAEVAEAVAGYLEAIGITVTLNLGEWTAHLGRWREKDFDGLWLFGARNATAGDPSYLTRLHFRSVEGGRFFNTPEVDALLDEMSAQTTLEGLRTVAGELQAVLKDEAPMIFGYDAIENYGISSALEWQPRPDWQINPFEMRWSGS